MIVITNVFWAPTELWWVDFVLIFSLTVLQGYDKQAMCFMEESTYGRVRQHQVWKFKD
jgi:hypothetical protein